jgi:hypothetical protein
VDNIRDFFDIERLCAFDRHLCSLLRGSAATAERAAESAEHPLNVVSEALELFLRLLLALFERLDTYL